MLLEISLRAGSHEFGHKLFSLLLLLGGGGGGDGILFRYAF